MKENYLKLLKYEKDSKEKGKFLTKENETEYRNLLNYKVSLLNHLKWEKTINIFY